MGTLKSALVAILAITSAGCALVNQGSSGSDDCNCAVSQPTSAATKFIGETNTGILAYAQSFRTAADVSIAGVQVSVAKVGTVNPPLQVAIHTDNAGVPNNFPLITSVTVNPSNTDVGLQSFCFSADCSITQALTADTAYWLVLTRPGSVTTTSLTDYSVAATLGAKFGTENMLIRNILAPAVWLSSSGVTDVSNESLVFRLGCGVASSECSL